MSQALCQDLTLSFQKQLPNRSIMLMLSSWCRDPRALGTISAADLFACLHSGMHDSQQATSTEHSITPVTSLSIWTSAFTESGLLAAFLSQQDDDQMRYQEATLVEVPVCRSPTQYRNRAAIFRGFLWRHLHKFSCVLSLLAVQCMGQKSHRPWEYAEILLKGLIKAPVKQRSSDPSE